MTERDGGKGDSQRPLGIPMDKFDEQWDLIFGKKPSKQEKNDEHTEGSAQHNLR